MSFEVIQQGFLSLLQDRGRLGVMHFGITQSGVMNETSYFWVNKLLGNPLDTTVIEMNMGGLQLKSYAETMIAIVGGQIPFSINNVLQPMNCTHYIKQGDELEFGFCQQGLRFYLGVKGGFEVSQSFGSSATDMKNQIGGLQSGQPLKKGDRLTFPQFEPTQTHHAFVRYRIPEKFLQTYQNPLKLRVLLGYQEDWFDQDAKQTFWSSTYTVSHLADRMGYRLTGNSVTPTKSHFISEGMSFGAIQIPKDGQPIVLLKDRQTIGGYPKIGTVFSLDAFALSERKTGDQVYFAPFDLSSARKQLQEFDGFFKHSFSVKIC